MYIPKRHVRIKNMDPRHVISFWLSLIILKTLPTEIKQLYRKYEKNKLKLTTLIAHRLFNETCINNNLLPIYTNIIYVYIVFEIFTK